MKKAKDGRDIELITLITNKEEFISKLPWKKEKEITPIHVAELAKKELKGKTDQKIGGGNSKCIKVLMAALEKLFSGKLFKIRMEGSDRFWSLTNPELLEEFRIQFEKKEETAILVPQEPKVVVPTSAPAPVPEIHLTPEEEIKEEVKSKLLPPPSKEDMIKTYFLIELLKSGPIESKSIKTFSDYMNWGKIYSIVNQTLEYYDVKNVVDTSGKRVIRLNPEVKRTDEDINILTTILESEVEIPEAVKVFIETLELPKEQPADTTEEEKEIKPTISLPKEDQILLLKKYIYDNGGQFQSDVFNIIKKLNLDKITCPEDEFKSDKEVMIFSKRNSKLNVDETFFKVKEEFYKRLIRQAEKEEEIAVVDYVKSSVTPQPEPEETVEVVIQESDHQPESKVETKPVMIELYSLKELNTGLKFSDSKQFLLSFWKYEIQIETKEDALRLIKFYYSHLGEVEFEDGATTLAALDNIVLNC